MLLLIGHGKRTSLETNLGSENELAIFSKGRQFRPSVGKTALFLGMQTKMTVKSPAWRSGNEISSGNDIACFPRYPCGRVYCHFGLHSNLLAESRSCLPLEHIARSFSETRLVSRDIRFPWPIKSNAAFLFACLNLYFSFDRWVETLT